jgi:hypothetical protein
MSEQDGETVRAAQSERSESTLTTSDLASRGQTSVVESGEDTAERNSLFDAGEARDFQARWDSIQTGFVDQPRRAVEQADHLVAEVIQRLAETFAEERSELEGQWGRGDQVSTEDLRLALQRYRSFFSRLLSMERPT